MLYIGEKIKNIVERIEKAKSAAGRSAPVKLVAVTKTVPPEAVEESLKYGITDIGESRIQEAEKKLPALTAYKVKKHLIGHLQTNKARKAVALFDVIQSVDSLRLLEEIDRHAAAAKKIQECFLEVKISLEDTKFGLAPEMLAGLLDKSKTLVNVKVAGLMAMATFFDDPESARPYFREAYRCYTQLSGSYALDWLSMGMTGDFEVAVEEGSNMVRIGTGIYGEKK